MKLLASWFLATFIVIAVADQQHSQMGQTYTMATLTIRKVLTLFTPDVLKGIDATQDLIQAQIIKNQKLVISDIGCYDGFNSFETIKAVIQKIRAIYGSDFTIEVAYSDLASKPYSFMQELLNKPTLLGENVITSYAAQNIFERLPYQSDITICSYATHWLSEKINTSQPLSSIFPSRFTSKSAEKKSADIISATDIEKFYQARQADTAAFVACIHMIKQEEHGLECTAHNVMVLMDDVFSEMYTEREIKSSNFYIPFAYRTTEQITASAAKANCGTLINNAIQMPSVFSELYTQGKLSEIELGQWAAKEARGWSEGSVQALVGETRVEEFYQRLAQKIQHDPLNYLSHHYIQFIITTATL